MEEFLTNSRLPTRSSCSYIPLYTCLESALAVPGTVYHALLTRLKGSRVRIPNLTQVVPTWPQGVNPHMEELRGKVDEFIDRILADRKEIAEECKKADLALFCSSFWPEAGLRELMTIAFYVVWVFAFDDEFDTKTGLYSRDLQAGSKACHEAQAFMSHCLKLKSNYAQVKPESKLISGLSEVGQRFCEDLDYEQREWFFKEFEYYMKMTVRELQHRVEGVVPSFDEYVEVRLGTSAVSTAFVLIELSTHKKLPASFRDSPEMEKLKKETNKILSLINDMISWQREFSHGCVYSAVPVIVQSGSHDLQQAPLESYRHIQESVKAFEESSQKLQQQAKGDDLTAVSAFIRGCQFFATGNVHWSLNGTRYGASNFLKEANGDLTCTL